jgi:hypothetical protein
MIILKIELSLLVLVAFFALFSHMAEKGCDPVLDKRMVIMFRNATATSILLGLVLLMLTVITCAWVLL